MGAEADRVGDDERLWRRVHRDHYVATSGGWRVASAAFRTNDPELSIDRAEILESMGLGPPYSAGTGVGVAEARAADYRAAKLEPVPDPLPTGHPDAPHGNPAHAVVRKELTKGEAKAMARVCGFIGAS